MNLPLDHRAATNLSYMFAELYQKVVVFGLPRYDKSIRSGYKLESDVSVMQTMKVHTDSLVSVDNG